MLLRLKRIVSHLIQDNRAQRLRNRLMQVETVRGNRPIELAGCPGGAIISMINERSIDQFELTRKGHMPGFVQTSHGLKQ
jgi:hypothetical protein